MINNNSVNSNTTKQPYILTNQLRKNTSSASTSKKVQDSSDGALMNKTYEYVIEGGFIKIYLVMNGMKKQCIKSIPLKEADASILAKVQNLTMLDVMIILDMIEEKKLRDKEESSSSKAIIEYSKHFDTDDDCMNAGWLNL